MKYHFEYDHSRLSLVRLHESGIRSTIMLEEVIEWEFTEWIEDPEFDFLAIWIEGLTKDCRGIELVFTFDEMGRIVTLDAKIADRERLRESILNTAS